MMTATVPTPAGRLRVVFEPVVENGKVVGVGEIKEAYQEFMFRGTSSVENAASLIAREGLRPAILAAAEVAQ